MTKLIYLAAPIDFATDNANRDEAKKKLLEVGFVVFDPFGAWAVGKAEPDARVQEFDCAVVRRCDGVLALLPTRVVTYGTIMEVVAAQSFGVPVVAVGQQLKHSWSMAGINTVDTVTAAVGYLIEHA